MSNIVPAGNFSDRLYKKIREDLGSIMTDDEIKKLVEVAIEKEFFAPVVVTEGYRQVTKSSKLIEIVKEVIGPKVKEAVSDWLANNPEKVEAAIKSSLEGGISATVLRGFDSILSNTFASLGYNLEQSIRNSLIR